LDGVGRKAAALLIPPTLDLRVTRLLKFINPIGDGLIMNINWRERFIAAGIHFLVTLALAGLAAALIFFVWFPGAMADMVGGTKLFLMVVGIDLALGPLISLIIFNSKKPRRELVIDYIVIGVVQIAALIYGVYTVAATRPAFIVFHGDRLELVRSIDLDDADLAMGTAPEFRTRSLMGPRLVAVQMPTDVKERNDLMFSAVGGKDAELMPKYYRAYETRRDDIAQRSKSIDELRAERADEQPELDRAIADAKIAPEKLRWLPMRHRFGFAIALLDAETQQPITYIAVEPKF
jgi:hypothetical protein